MTTCELRDDRSNISFIHDTHVLSILQLSPNRDQQVFRKAFIHSTAILFVIVCGICAVLVYCILEPFIQSILWAILTGAFLFPFKNHFTSIARYHLQELETNSHLLFYGLVIILPFQILDKTIESIGPLCIDKWKQLILIIIFLPSIEFLQSGVVYRCITTIGYDYYILFERHIHIFDSLWVILFVIIYFLAVLTVYNSSSVIKSILKIFSIPTWFILFIYLSQIFPSHYRLIVVTLTIILIFIGYIVDQNMTRSHRSQVNQSQEPILIHTINRFERIRNYFHIKSTLSNNTSSSSSSSSAPYFSFVIWSFVAIKIYQFYWYLIPISIFVIIYKIIKYFLLYTYTYLSQQTHVQHIIQRFSNFWKIRRNVLTPLPYHSFIRFFIKGDKKMNYILQESIDYLASACIIIALFILIAFGTILLLIQIHHESIHMIKLTSSFINETIVLQHILPDKEHMSHLMDTAVNKFYTSGRRWITTQVAKVQPPRVEPQCCLPLSVTSDESHYMPMNTFGPGSLSNKNLEEQVLQLWDRLYTYVTNTSTLFISHKNRSRILNISSSQSFLSPNFLIYIQTNFQYHLNDLYHLISDNIDLLRTILDSIWSNATLLLTVISTIISLLFTGGFALFNFLISFIVFITLLFYLLSNSTQPIYRPTVWLNNILAIGGSGLGQAVNDAVTSVFIASLKIATFYGLYTYIIHTLLCSNLVFLPAMIASICAVTLKSYWAALPGCLDLWLVQQRPLSALILLLAQIVPVYIVDTAIYSEVKGGGHQYLTALAIAGGAYYRGIEGALIGPIILCCLLVGIRMYNETIATTLLSNSQQSPVILNNIKQRLNRSASLQSVMTRNDYD
ncbi:unnamed protein product [Adineta steineri]|uniref:Transmembrane protein n=1 Tax=Adineta steineri TaxID=433720 RepID=A0A814IW99_9BILA|nr:unnamed protein product [Adineta steineri]CAF1401331.1 unnamed protein product [Adineta steineri]